MPKVTVDAFTTLTRKEQIAHINEHLAKFQAHMMSDRLSVSEYFDDYADEYDRDNDGMLGALYVCLCADLGIEPLE